MAARAAGAMGAILYLSNFSLQVHPERKVSGTNRIVLVSCEDHRLYAGKTSFSTTLTTSISQTDDRWQHAPQAQWERFCTYQIFRCRYTQKEKSAGLTESF